MRGPVPGNPFLHPVAEIEQMSDGELRELAEEQAAVIEGLAWSKEQLQEALDRVVRVG